MKAPLEIKRRESRIFRWREIRRRLAILVALTATPLVAAAVERIQVRSLADLSIEELLNESVTSVSKREQRLGDVASAVTLLSNEEIRRSGATSLPEALRLVPGMNVGAVNAREWAVSARGFNGVFANKLLVMMDGRAVYNPLSSGVFWDLQQVMLEDVERIEVIRGPGATIWGANAVNGVVNVVTQSARDTQGGLVYGGGGDQHQALAGARYGGQLGETTYYRVFGSHRENDEFTFANGQPAGDDWTGWHGGFRVDYEGAEDTHLTWQSDLSTVRYEAGISDGTNVNTLARWSRDLSERSSLEVQAYYDRVDAKESRRAHPLLQSYDLSAQQTFASGERHDLIWGVGLRYLDNSIEQETPMLVIRKAEFDQRLYSAFVQDEIKLVPNVLILTAGAKLEHNSYTGYELQPSVRAVWKPASNQTAWGAISRAVRTPSGSEGADVFGVVAGPPLVGPDGGLYAPTIVGNGHPRSEVLVAYESGYRIQPVSQLSVDLAVFFNDYSQVIDVAFDHPPHFVPGNPIGVAEMPFSNLTSARTYGGEISVTFSASDHWRLVGGYSLLASHFSGPVSVNPSEQEQGAPKHQSFLRTSWDLGRRASFDAQIRSASKLQDVPSYVTGDARVAYRVMDKLEIAVVGQNLFDPHHPEQGPAPITVNSELSRSYHVKAIWRF